MSFLLASPPDVIAPVCVCGTVSVADSYFFSLRQCASLGPQCLAPIFGCVRCPRSSSRSFLFPCHHVVCLVPCQPCHLKEMHNTSRDQTAHAGKAHQQEARECTGQYRHNIPHTTTHHITISTQAKRGRQARSGQGTGTEERDTSDLLEGHGRGAVEPRAPTTPPRHPSLSLCLAIQRVWLIKPEQCVCVLLCCIEPMVRESRARCDSMRLGL